MPSPLTETHVIEGEPDAFHDAALVAEVVRIYNYKRAFCGQTRIDLGTPTTKVFKEATNYADGPVTEDVDTEVSCRDTGSFRDYLLLLWIAIPQTYATKKTVGADSYYWVTPSTDDPLPLPDGWEDLGVTADTLKNPALWGHAFPLIIEAVNALQEMAITVKPRLVRGDMSWTGRYLTWTNHEGPQRFQIKEGASNVTGTLKRPLLSSLAMENRAYTGEVLNNAVGFYGSHATTWSFSVPGYDSPQFAIRNPLNPSSGDATDALVGMMKGECSVRVYVQTTGSYTIRMGGAVNNVWPRSTRKAILTFDGETLDIPLNTPNPIPPYSKSIVRTITAPYEDFDFSIELDDLSVSDMWTGLVSDSGTREYQVYVGGPLYPSGGNVSPSYFRVYTTGNGNPMFQFMAAGNFGADSPASYGEFAYAGGGLFFSEDAPYLWDGGYLEIVAERLLEFHVDPEDYEYSVTYSVDYPEPSSLVSFTLGVSAT